MNSIEKHLQERLDMLKKQGLSRSLPESLNGIDFCSNDYLGLSRSKGLASMIRAEDDMRLGSGGSRWLSGNSRLAEKVEKYIAHFHHSEAALLFSTGYLANLGLFSTVATKDDAVITDEYIHESVEAGISLSGARHIRFKHNDLEDLHKKLLLAGEKGRIFIAVESIYFRDGSIAPLLKISQLAEQFQASLIVDEAHSTGVLGDHGRGLVVAEGLEKVVFARIHTFGKALGMQGAAIVGSNRLRTFLIHYANSFGFSTGLSPYNLRGIQAAYRLMPAFDYQRERLEENIAYFHKKVAEYSWILALSPSWIQSIKVGGANRIQKMVSYLHSQGIRLHPLLYPQTAPGKESIRICLHSYNTPLEIDLLFSALSNAQKRGLWQPKIQKARMVRKTKSHKLS